MIERVLSPDRIEALAPEPGAVDAAWADVNRRRRQRLVRAQVGAGLGVALLLIVALLPSLGTADRPAELDVAGRDTIEGRTSESPSLLDTDSQNTPEEGGGDDSNPASALSGTPAESVGDPPGRPSAPGTAAPAPGRPKPPVEQTRRETLYIGCIEWCLSPRVIPEGDSYLLNLDLCVGVGSGTRRFSYATVQEVDFWVATQGTSPDTLWTWSLGQQFAAREHHVDIASGECVRWTALWDGTDEQGKPLPPGDYRLFAKSLAEQAERNSTTETTFRIP